MTARSTRGSSATSSPSSTWSPRRCKSPRLPRRAAADALAAWLAHDPAPEIVADWPEDLAQLAMLLVTGPGQMLTVPPLTLRFEPLNNFSTAANSAVPHNALHDARALRDHRHEPLGIRSCFGSKASVMVPFSFAGHDFLASPDGALHWPAERALLVADLHLEKASWFARLGQFLPPYDQPRHAASRSSATSSAAASTRLYCLGDSFHDRFGCDRLPAAARDLLTAMTARLDWVWIVGNHDAGFIDHCGGRLAEEIHVGGIVLRHEADARRPARPKFRATIHPKLRLSMKGRNVSRRCYVATATKLILPAYGALTGGLDAAPSRDRQEGRPRRLGAGPVTDRLLRFPIAA